MENITREMQEERREFNLRPNLLTISLNDELVQELVFEDILLDKETMEQQFGEESSFLKEIELSP